MAARDRWAGVEAARYFVALFALPRRGLRHLEHVIDEAHRRLRGLEPEGEHGRLGRVGRRIDVVESRLEPRDEGRHQRPLSDEKGFRIEPEPLSEHDLQQEQRPDLPDVFDRFEQPLGDRFAPHGRGCVDDAVRATPAAFEPGREDVTVRLEVAESGVDERPGDRPDRADLAVVGERRREAPAVTLPLTEQREHAIFAR